MTGEQAQVILDRLCILFRYEPKGGPQAWGREAEEWIVQLAPIPFEVAEEAVQRIARDERFRFMPTIPEFMQYIDEMRQQGVANAPGPAASATVDAFSLWRQRSAPRAKTVMLTRARKSGRAPRHAAGAP